MKCKNKEVAVQGFEAHPNERKIIRRTLWVICSNDEHGKSLSVNNGEIQFTIPMDEIAKYFEGDYRK